VKELTKNIWKILKKAESDEIGSIIEKINKVQDQNKYLFFEKALKDPLINSPTTSPSSSPSSSLKGE